MGTKTEETKKRQVKPKKNTIINDGNESNEKI